MEKQTCFRVSDDLSLEGVLHLPHLPAKAGVVICHGLLSDKDSKKHSSLARDLCSRGIAALRFDFEGRGRSPGDMLELSFSRQVVQARAAVRTLMESAGVEKVGLSGSSMGGAVAALLAADNPGIHCLVTMAAVARTDLLGERIVGPKALAAWERRGSLRFDEELVGWSLVEDGTKVDVPGAASQVRCPWLIIHGQKDDVVPISDAELLRDSANCDPRLNVISGADHSFSDDVHRQKVVQIAVDFFCSNLPAGMTE